MEQAAKYTLTVREFAKRMQVSEPTARAIMNREGFPLLKVGKRRLVLLDGLNEWLRKQVGQVG